MDNRGIEDRITEFQEKVFNNNDTIVYRKLNNLKCKVKSCLIFNEGIIDGRIINGLVKILMYDQEIQGEDKLKLLKESKLVAKDINIIEETEEAIEEILMGNTIVIIDGEKNMLSVETKKYAQRSIMEPQSESVLRGPREGFVEVMMTNLSLIRRKINNEELKMEISKIGKQSKTKIAICYMENLVNKKILKSIKKRIGEIDVDYLLSSGKIIEFIEDHPKSPFRTIGVTERPDVVCAKILDGKVAVICDGSPVAITMPYLFHEYFEANEDDYNHYIYSSINRVIRYLAFFIGSSLPALYVAAATFHRELIPTQLSLSIYLARVGVPFPTVVECFLMMLIFEIIREAAIRLPKHIGPAISIVGALVLGDAAVKAKIVSSPMVIVIATTEISSLLLADMQEGLIFMRFIFLLSSSTLGLFGYIFAVMGVFTHLLSMKSFGVKYMLYMGNLKEKDILRTLLRGPWWKNRLRTKEISDNEERIATKENLGDNNEKKI